MKDEITQIKNMIYEIRGQKVMFDNDLAALYQVETKYLNKTVKRNLSRFPADFMFQLTKSEITDLRCQFGTSSWGGQDICFMCLPIRHYVLAKSDTNEQIAELRKLLIFVLVRGKSTSKSLIPFFPYRCNRPMAGADNYFFLH